MEFQEINLKNYRYISIYKLQINLADYKYNMSEYRTHHREQINQELFDFLMNEEKKIQELSLNNNSTRNKAASIAYQYEQTQKDRIKDTNKNAEFQNLQSRIQGAFVSFTSQLKNQSNFESNLGTKKQSSSNSEKEINLKDEQIKKKQEQINSLKVNLLQKERQISQMADNYKLQLVNKERSIKQLQARLRKCKVVLKQLKTPIHNLKKDLQLLKADCSKKTWLQVEQKMIEQLRIIMSKKKVQQAEKLNKQKEKAQKQNNFIFEQIELFQRDLSRFAGFTIDQQLTTQNKIKAFYNQLEIYVKYSHTFSDSTIIQDQSQKKWLLQRVSQTIGGRYFTTRMIFKFETLNKTSFHKYIDGKPNILLIVKLINGYKIGGFCKTPIQKQRVEKHRDGFLYSLTLREKYQPKSANQALVSYDDFFIIFGNSEVRIKSFETKVFSNFGANSGVFATYGKKFVDFLGSEINEIQLSHFQIYEIAKNQM